MIWAQGGVCFLIWIAYGWVLRKRSDRLRKRLFAMERRTKVLLGSAGLLLGLVVLVAGMLLIAAGGGIQDGVLTWWAWIGVTAVGLVFIQFQVLGAAAMISLVLEPPETAEKPQASDSTKDQS
jgi:uncharacterized protein YacL